jgi:transposase
VVAADADHARAGARRGGHRTLGKDDVAGAKKNAARRRATIVFLDESGFSERPAIRGTWAPRGHTPVLIHRLRSWRNLSAIGAVAYPSRSPRRARLLLATHTENVRSPHVVRFLKHLRRHLRGPVVLLWDGLNAHRSIETRAYLDAQRSWLTVHRLPAYAPELNPVEGVWSWFKGTVAANLCPEGLAPIRRQLGKGRRRLHRRPDLFQSFLHKAGLFI